MRVLVKKATIILLAAVLLAGCGKASGNGFVSENAVTDKNIEIADDSISVIKDTVDTELSDSSTGADARKIILTYTYEIETKDLDKSVQAIEAAVNKAGGYYETSKVDGNTENGGYAKYVLRIPTDKLDDFIQGVNTFGNIASQSRNGEDVTSQYYDIESSLASLKIQQERLLELLKQAKSLDDIMKLETELTKVRTNIEKLTTSLKKYDNLIDYTTVNITVDQVSDYTVSNQNFGQTVIDTFCDSFSTAFEMAKRFLLALIWMLPYIIVIGIIVAVAVVFDIRAKKKRNSKKM